MPETLELARHAQSLGVTAIGYMAPVFFKPKTEQQTAELLATVRERSGKRKSQYEYSGV